MAAALAMVFGSTLLPAAESGGIPVNTQKSTLNAQNGTKSADFDTKMHIFEPIRPVPVREERNERTAECERQVEQDQSEPETDYFIIGNTDGMSEDYEDGSGQLEASDPEPGQEAGEDSGEDVDPASHQQVTESNEITDLQPNLQPEASCQQVTEPEPETEESGSMEYLGEWTISFYCNCEACCGQWSGGATASGTMPEAWWTAATSDLPFGTTLYVDGLGTFEVQDRGTEYGWLDVFVSSHDEALANGLQSHSVYIVR